jgi:hypothetical protein
MAALVSPRVTVDSLTSLRAHCDGLIADGRIDVPVRTFPLPAIGDAWLAAASSGSRVVVLPG